MSVTTSDGFVIRANRGASKKQRRAAARQAERARDFDALVNSFRDKFNQMHALRRAAGHCMIEQAKLYVQLKWELQRDCGVDPLTVTL